MSTRNDVWLGPDWRGSAKIKQWTTVEQSLNYRPRAVNQFIQKSTDGWPISYLMQALVTSCTQCPKCASYFCHFVARLIFA
jgi:hypothetical protein